MLIQLFVIPMYSCQFFILEETLLLMLSYKTLNGLEIIKRRWAKIFAMTTFKCILVGNEKSWAFFEAFSHAIQIFRALMHIFEFQTYYKYFRWICIHIQNNVKCNSFEKYLDYEIDVVWISYQGILFSNNSYLEFR